MDRRGGITDLWTLMTKQTFRSAVANMPWTHDAHEERTASGEFCHAWRNTDPPWNPTASEDAGPWKTLRGWRVKDLPLEGFSNAPPNTMP
mmetsp:Transcript_19721/g.44779  ORF Transcript_19721/g.44779 Transcript_19721/m.44779 type:complete len:90 (+) Transcript_19721:535-804(+)